MLLVSLLALSLAASAPITGATVDSAADDRAIFQNLEAAAQALAENSEGILDRKTRLAQCERRHTAALTLAPPNRSTLAGEEIFRRAASAAVLIGTAYKCDKCTKWHHSLASGFIISTGGVIATNHHVAANPVGEAMGVLTSDGKFYPVIEVLAADEAHDVALIRIAANNLPALPLRDDAPAGSPIFCYSHPANAFGCITEGIITRYCKLNEPARKGAVFMQTTADYARGSSGGPLLDSAGNAIGLVASTSPVFTTPPIPPTGTKETKPAALPSQQMIRHNCATARALLDLFR